MMQKIFHLHSLDDTKKIAEMLGKRMHCGEVVTLAGDLGAGKTTFAQFLIQSLSVAAVEVTSPTFNLLQTYPVQLADGHTLELYHYDLYRIENPSALIELGFEDAVANLALIEWPERAASMHLPVTLALTFTLSENGARSVTIEGDEMRWGGCGSMSVMTQVRPERGDAMDDFLARIGWAGAVRRMLAGDASFRRYERVHFGNNIAVLMDAPPPWEDVRPFIAVTDVLARCGVTVPEIIARDEEAGFLLLEDLGDLSFTRLLRAEPTRERELYLAATDALMAIHTASMNNVDALSAALPPYDMAVYLREAALFAEWFLPQIHGIARAQELREEYLSIWRAILTRAAPKQTCIVHRDYHADNLFWLSERTGHHAVGMIDYQDALWGDPAYDLASLLEDARRDVSDSTVADCFARYCTDIGENAHEFAARFSVIAAQRNAKIIGIFARLCMRDGKAHYLDYLPRVWGHFTQDISHPMLAPLRAFVDAHVPPEWRGAFVADVSVGGIAP